MYVGGEGRDRAESAGEVEELFKLKMLLAQEQMDMAINILWVETQNGFYSSKDQGCRTTSQRGNYRGKIINRF